MGELHAILLPVLCGKHIALQPFAIIQRADQCFFGLCRAAITPFVMPPEHKRIHGSCIVTMPGYALAYAGGKASNACQSLPSYLRQTSWRRVRSLPGGWRAGHGSTGSICHAGNGSGRFANMLPSKRVCPASGTRQAFNAARMAASSISAVPINTISCLRSP